ncbi:hypothetical protein NKI59_22565 [Mesorhizobium sp. M0598]|uniref:hypothetical protein n=1 Tax=Mesorhizobium sp. M0598 TaxID=2956968 RepID=UPI00333650AC
MMREAGCSEDAANAVERTPKPEGVMQAEKELDGRGWLPVALRVANPDMMLNPNISARILILGLIDGRWNGSKPPHRGKGIGHYLPRNGGDDAKNARRTVNRLDKWKLIAGYYRVFLAVILQSRLIE